VGILSDPSFLLIQLLAGLSRGMSLFIVSAGLTLIYGVLKVLNFAHGSFLMLGAYMGFTLTQILGGDPNAFWIALIVAPIGVALLGGILEFTLLRRFYEREHVYQLLLTYALVLIIASLAKLIWGGAYRVIELPIIFSGQVQIWGRAFPTYYLFMLIMGAIVAIALWWIIQRTRIGYIMRASAGDSETASTLGVNVGIVFSFVFMLGSYLAGLGGVVTAVMSSVGPGMDMDYILISFIIVIVGGIGSIPGALIGAILIGVTFAFGILVLPRLAEAFLFLFMIIVLIVRPLGIMGRKVERV